MSLHELSVILDVCYSKGNIFQLAISSCESLGFHCFLLISSFLMDHLFIHVLKRVYRNKVVANELALVIKGHKLNLITHTQDQVLL